MGRLKYVAAAFACAGMLVLGFWGGQLIEQAGVRGLRSAVYAECHRQNVSRITGNRNNNSQYKLWSAALTLFQYGESQAGNGPKPTNQEALLLTALLSAMTSQLHTESWTPLSDCTQATDHPATYVPPPAIPFSQQLPPLSAFTIGANE